MEMLKKIIIVGGAVLLLTFTTSHSFAGDIIHGCFQQGTGILRAVTGPDDCKRSEVYLFWNETGPQGEQGPQGEPGPAGPGIADFFCPPGESIVGFQAGSPVCTGDLDDHYKIFISSEEYTGDFGGLDAADAVCDNLAATAGLAGDYKAFLSDSTTLVGDRLYHSPLPYKSVNGDLIADDWDQLIIMEESQGLFSAAMADENGYTLADYFAIPSNTSLYIWTGGITAIGQNCSNWEALNTTGKAIDWVSVQEVNQSCNTSARIYCIEQPQP